MSSSSSSSSSLMEKKKTFDILVHPLVILNMSDHYTRKRLDGQEKDPRVIGALFGTQDGRQIEIRTSFEIDFSEKNGDIHVSEEYIANKAELYSEIFPNYEILGWYTNGINVSPKETNVHKQFLKFNENPLLLLIDMRIKMDEKELPLQVFESTADVDEKGEIIVKLFKSTCQIETEESERNSLDTISSVSDATEKKISSLVPHFQTLVSANQMLNDNVGKIIAYLQKIENGELPPNDNLLREISSFSSSLPLMDTKDFKNNFNRDMNESLMITLLSVLTKGSFLMNEVVDKYSATYGEYAMKRRRGFW